MTRGLVNTATTDPRALFHPSGQQHTATLATLSHKEVFISEPQNASGSFDVNIRNSLDCLEKKKSQSVNEILPRYA